MAADDSSHIRPPATPTPERDVRTVRLQTLAHLNRVVASSQKLTDILSEVAQAAATLMGATFASFSLADERTRTLEVAAFSDPLIGAELPFQRRRFDDGVVGWVATHRQP